jgi:cell division protein FtsB
MSGPSERAAARQAARHGGSTRPGGRSGSASRSARTGGTADASSAAATGSTASGAGPSRTKAGSAKASSAKAAAALRQRPNLTGRAVILASALALIVFTLAVPAREVISQRQQIAALQAANDAQSNRVEALQVQQQRLQDPAYITSLIRERLHYVMPGEVGYVVLDPSEAPAPTAKKAAATAVAWYSTVWSSVRTTDDAGVAAQQPKITVRPNAPR